MCNVRVKTLNWPTQSWNDIKLTNQVGEFRHNTSQLKNLVKKKLKKLH